MTREIVDLTQTEIPGFKIMYQYQKGGYGRVYMIQNILTDDIKVVKKSFTAYKEFQKYRGFTHDNIVSPLYKLQVGEYDLIFFERWDLNLKQYMENGKPTMKNKTKIFYQIFQALKYIHSNNYGHNDIKARNILIKLNPFKVGLADFSLADKDSVALKKTDMVQLGLLWCYMSGVDLLFEFYRPNLDHILSQLPLDFGKYLEDKITLNIFQKKILSCEKLSEFLVAEKQRVRDSRLRKGKKLTGLKQCKKCWKKLTSKYFSNHVKNCK